MTNYKRPDEQTTGMALEDLSSQVRSTSKALNDFEGRIKKRTASSFTGVRTGTSDPAADQEAVKKGKEVVEPVAEKVNQALGLGKDLTKGSRFTK